MTLGPRGEKIAARFLKKLGYKIVSRNYESSAGEIDLIALDGDSIVFVEVKSRSSRSGADPETAVGWRKQQQLSRVAKYYLSSKNLSNRPCRFDVIGVLIQDGCDPDIEHFVNAFPPIGAC